MNKHTIGAIAYFLVLLGGGAFLLYLKDWDKDFIIEALLFGIVTSVIGSIAFIILLWMLKPSIKISNSIARTKQSDKETGEEKDIYLFKIVNNSWFFSLYNLEVSLFVVRKETVEGGINSRFDRLNIKKEKITRIPNKSSDKSDAFYAQILTSSEPLYSHLRRKDNYIELQIMARHALSGFSKVFTQPFHTQSCVSEGEFAHGDNFSIH